MLDAASVTGVEGNHDLKHALILIGNLKEVGGGLKVGAWAAQALARDHELTILSWTSEELSELDRMYGTSLAGSTNINIVCAPVWLSRLLLPIRGHLSLFRTMILMRMGRALVEKINPDLVVSNVGETDLGRPLVQYIHHPWMVWPRPKIELQWYHWTPAVLAYRKLCTVIGHYNRDRVLNNLTLVNSEWTRNLYEKWYGASATVLYPPVIVDDTANLQWAKRDNAFVCIGRFSPEKRLLESIAIVKQLRDMGHDLDLHLCGLRSNDSYFKLLQEAATRAGPWVKIHVGLSREKLLQLVGQCRYGLHAMIDEHFGIAVAEMMRLGCVPFVHQSGGPQEIVADERLTWNNEEEAVTRIVTCIEQPDLCAILREHAATRAKNFSAETFMEQLLGHCARSAK